MRHASLPRVLITGLAVPATLAATGSAALAATGTASGGLPGPACTVTWVGGGQQVLWNDPENWSTDHVPGPASDVCMSPFAIVTASGPITIHSLRVGGQMTVVFEGSPSQPSHVNITTFLDNLGNVELQNSSLTAAQVTNANGLESSGTSVLTSPALRNNGTIDAIAGSLTLTDSLAQLSHGALTSGSWDALANGRLVLPGDVTSLVSGEVGIGANSAINDQRGREALAGLTSIGPGATLALSGGALSLVGSLTSNGSIDVGSYVGGAQLTLGGTLNEAQGTIGLLSQSTVTAATVTVGTHASLSADGTIVGNLVNNGAVGPAYHLSVTGNYTQTASASLGAGFVPELMVGGKATLAGTLIASEAPPPVPGARGTAITFASVSGGFTGHNLGFNIVSGPHEIGVVAQPQIAAAAATVAPGAPVTVNGGDFGLGSNVTVFLDRAGATAIGTARPGDQGTLTVTGTIPLSATAGTHKLIAVGSDGRQATATITVS